MLATSLTGLVVGLLLGGATLPPLPLRVARHRSVVLSTDDAVAADAPAAKAAADEVDPAQLYKPPRLDSASLSVGQVVACTIIGKLAPGPKQKYHRG